jgi:hypothetical protein
LRDDGGAAPPVAALKLPTSERLSPNDTIPVISPALARPQPSVIIPSAIAAILAVFIENSRDAIGASTPFVKK